jgi:hypothetical protein
MVKGSRPLACESRCRNTGRTARYRCARSQGMSPDSVAEAVASAGRRAAPRLSSAGQRKRRPCRSGQRPDTPPAAQATSRVGKLETGRGATPPFQQAKPLGGWVRHSRTWLAKCRKWTLWYKITTFSRYGKYRSCGIPGCAAVYICISTMAVRRRRTNRALSPPRGRHSGAVLIRRCRFSCATPNSVPVSARVNKPDTDYVAHPGGRPSLWLCRLHVKSRRKM